LFNFVISSTYSKLNEYEQQWPKERPSTLAHAYNTSYSGGRDHEGHCSNPALVNSSQNPILKKTHHKKGMVERLKVLKVEWPGGQIPVS
jgi:hypothetical protein